MHFAPHLMLYQRLHGYFKVNYLKCFSTKSVKTPKVAHLRLNYNLTSQLNNYMEVNFGRLSESRVYVIYTDFIIDLMWFYHTHPNIFRLSKKERTKLQLVMGASPPAKKMFIGEMRILPPN